MPTRREGTVLSRVIPKIQQRLERQVFPSSSTFFVAADSVKAKIVCDQVFKYDDGTLIIIEVELGSPCSSHIQSHVLNFALFTMTGSRIDRVIWIIERPFLIRFRNEVSGWRHFFEHYFGADLPGMEIYSTSGTLLDAV